MSLLRKLTNSFICVTLLGLSPNKDSETIVNVPEMPGFETTMFCDWIGYDLEKLAQNSESQEPYLQAIKLLNDSLELVRNYDSSEDVNYNEDLHFSRTGRNVLDYLKSNDLEGSALYKCVLQNTKDRIYFEAFSLDEFLHTWPPYGEIVLTDDGVVSGFVSECIRPDLKSLRAGSINNSRVKSYLSCKKEEDKKIRIERYRVVQEAVSDGYASEDLKRTYQLSLDYNKEVELLRGY